MNSIEDLLDLVKEFPQAFAGPEDVGSQVSQSNSVQNSSTGAKIRQLLNLIDEFPDAFADPCLAATPTGSLEALEGTPVSEPVASNSAQVDVAQSTPELSSLPPGYAEALRRRVQTLTWGQVDFDLVYEPKGLAEIWIVVGKSGTEIQSLGEAIARLINLLLLNQVPVPEVVRQIRGIRGADSEGLGPHRILGLADLIGKVLQEAPAHRNTPWVGLNTSISSSTQNLVDLQENNRGMETYALQTVAVTNSPSSNNEASLDPILSSSAAGALCPECGAELSQVNGCKGGACVVCGYSSCS